MTNVRGMTLQQFYDVLEEMRKIYPFEADKTHLGNFRDLPSDSMRNVEIITRDDARNFVQACLQIVLSKGVDF